MGLFIGASILTILELFDYAYEVSVFQILFSTFNKLSEFDVCISYLLSLSLMLKCG